MVACTTQVEQSTRSNAKIRDQEVSSATEFRANVRTNAIGVEVLIATGKTARQSEPPAINARAKITLAQCAEQSLRTLNRGAQTQSEKQVDHNNRFHHKQISRRHLLMALMP